MDENAGQKRERPESGIGSRDEKTFPLITLLPSVYRFRLTGESHTVNSMKNSGSMSV